MSHRIVRNVAAGFLVVVCLAATARAAEGLNEITVSAGNVDRHDSVVTWGSEGGAPYVSGVPVGRVTSVYSSLRETSQRAVIDPYVDFGALDVVGVIVPSGTASDRAVIEADGRLR